MTAPTRIPVVFESTYLEFVETADTGKTKRWDVMSKNGGYCLGEIAWHGPWRCYTLLPAADTIWNGGCLTDILTFIAMQMDARRRARR